MAVCGLRTLLLIVCILELIITIQRQVFDFLGYMWLPITSNFINIILIIFGSFGAVQYVTKYLIAYAIWSVIWFSWNIFLICYYLNVGTLDRENGLLSLGTGSVSWWESNGWGCQPVWGEVDGPGTWRPARVDGCFFQWHHVELAQSIVAALLTVAALPLAVLLIFHSLKKQKPTLDKATLPRRQVYTLELSPTETNISESSLKPMTPRRVKRRSGSRGNGSSVKRSRRSYRNAGYTASNASLPSDPRPSRPTSAHSSYSNFHAARPNSYHPDRDGTLRSQDTYEPPPPPVESIPIMTNRYETVRRSVRAEPSHDVVGPFNEPSRYDPPRHYDTNVPPYGGYEGGQGYESRVDIPPCDSPYGANGYVTNSYPMGDCGWEAPPPPAPPYSARATPQAPGPPAYQQNDNYNIERS
ncbi:uncharacterized protein LOC126969355 [Leptidea sinapis]|uniref:uncharacterized protein LOC126969355 n=1 Tax=Leptidea sinapis TaxID=189913 RepID=UPI002142EEB9|nr:uncharacterized protein LOC126969355 [Leptidea sinapis]